MLLNPGFTHTHTHESLAVYRRRVYVDKKAVFVAVSDGRPRRTWWWNLRTIVNGVRVRAKRYRWLTSKAVFFRNYVCLTMKRHLTWYYQKSRFTAQCLGVIKGSKAIIRPFRVVRSVRIAFDRCVAWNFEKNSSCCCHDAGADQSTN